MVFFLTSCAHLNTVPSAAESTSVNFKFDQDLTQFEYEFAKLSVPTVLINGDRDKTAPGKPWALPGKAKLMGNYPQLGRSVARSIPQGRLVELKGLGHVPFIEDYEAFAKVFFKEVVFIL